MSRLAALLEEERKYLAEQVASFTDARDKLLGQLEGAEQALVDAQSELDNFDSVIKALPQDIVPVEIAVKKVK